MTTKKTKEIEKYGLTVNEAVEVMGVCERTVRKLIAEDRMPYFMVGRAVRIPWKPLKEWMDNGGTGVGHWVSDGGNRFTKAGAK